MKEVVPDPSETEIEDFPHLDQRVQPPSDDLRGLGHNHLAPPLEPHAPEVPPGAENVTSWDDNPVDEGHAVPRLLPEDEAGVFAGLIDDGMDEADRDLRKTARHNTPTASRSDDL